MKGKLTIVWLKGEHRENAYRLFVIWEDLWQGYRTLNPHCGHTWMGCLSASSTEIREVSLTRDGFPNRASIYRPATEVAFLAE